MKIQDLQSTLAAPFDDDDIEWRLQWADDEKGSGIAVPYVTNRAIQNRLDKAVGVGGWKNEYIPWHSDGKKQSQLCGISICIEDRNEWVTKYDGAEDSDIESVKGGLSDSMKRAAVQWGVGRYLYSMDTVYVDTEKRGKTTVIKKNQQDKLNKAHQKAIKLIFGASVPLDPMPLPARDERTSTLSSAPQSQQEIPKKERAYVYTIKGVTLQPSVNGHYTHIQMQGADGKTIQAFMQGTNPNIIKGARIINADISEKKQDGVVFYTLNSFEFDKTMAA